MRLFSLKFFKMVNTIFNILKETKPFLISIETKGRKIFRGNLTFIEENMNCILENTILIDQDGKLLIPCELLIKLNLLLFLLF